MSRANFSSAPSRPPGCSRPKSTGGEAAAFQERDRERVAERELHERGGGRRQIVRAGFARLRQHQRHVGGLAERAGGVRGDGDEADPEAPRIVDQVLELGGFARPGQRHDDVVGRDHAEIAVACLAGMDEKRRRAGRGERRGDLARDVAGLAHAGDDDAALGGADQLDGGDEGAPQAIVDGGGQRCDASGLGLKRAQAPIR